MNMSFGKVIALVLTIFAVAFLVKLTIAGQQVSDSLHRAVAPLQQAGQKFDNAVQQGEQQVQSAENQIQKADRPPLGTPCTVPAANGIAASPGTVVWHDFDNGWDCVPQ